VKLAIARRGAIFLFASLLQACGGGGDGDNSGNGSGARLSISPKEISVSATPGDAAPIGSVTLSVNNLPASGVYLEAGHSASGIEALNFFETGPSQGTLQIFFRSPGSLLNDTYNDTIELRVCTNESCTKQIRGSPETIRTSYVVSGSGAAAATIDRNDIQVTVDTRDDSSRTETVRVTLSSAPASGIWIATTQSDNGISAVSSLTYSGSLADVNIEFNPGAYLGSGTFEDTVNVQVCYDSSCVRQVHGSPFTITTTLSVGVGAEPGMTPLEVASRVELPHNVIDAEFSKALNRIVMVGSYPVNALYVYDVATSTESQQLLSKIPTSVSVSPDGLTAAVGHDALISIVDLTAVGQPGAPAPTLLNVSTDVYDVVLDGIGYVHALPLLDQWENIHSVNISSNAEQLSSGNSIYAGARGRLHPSGDYLYTASNGLSPSDIEKWDITSGAATALYDSPYHGDYEMCGNLWFKESGTTIHTACGNTFKSSVVQAEDMTYTGALELSPSNFYGWTIRALSQSDAHNEIALIEYDFYHCLIAPSAGPCYTHIAFHEDDFLNRLAVYSIGPVSVNDTDYAQQGLFIFHDAVGPNRYLLSRLEGMPNPDAEYYVSVIP
jgi:hypothetical protein